jgi:hypothetical protein
VLPTRLRNEAGLPEHRFRRRWATKETPKKTEMERDPCRGLEETQRRGEEDGEETDPRRGADSPVTEKDPRRGGEEDGEETETDTVTVERRGRATETDPRRRAALRTHGPRIHGEGRRHGHTDPRRGAAPRRGTDPRTADDGSVERRAGEWRVETGDFRGRGADERWSMETGEAETDPRTRSGRAAERRRLGLGFRGREMRPGGGGGWGNGCGARVGYKLLGGVACVSACVTAVRRPRMWATAYCYWAGLCAS